MKKTLKIIGSVALLLLLLLLVWGLIEPYVLDQERYAVPMPGLPTEWQGETVAVIGDLQIGMWLANEGTVAEAVRAIIAEDPAAALLIGDFVYHTADPEGQEVQNAVDLVAPLVEAGIPTYAVLGNHDYSLLNEGGQKREELAERVAAALEAAGIPVLQNEALPLAHSGDGPPLYIVGVGSHYANNDLPEMALSSVPAQAPRVVMMHHPDSFEQVPASTAPLAVAGHTHGGQFSIPFTPQWSLLALVQHGDEVHAGGWIEASYGAAGNRLYVNRGIGMSLLPLRILTQPELTFFRLDQAQSDTLEEPSEVE